MTTQIIKEWVEELESDRYEQARDNLRTDEGYCCMGVLCEVFIKYFPQHEWFYDDEARVYNFMNMDVMPTKEVIEWAGISEDDATGYACDNDHGMTFNYIANKIRQKYLK